MTATDGIDRSILIRDYLRDLDAGDAAIFAGAGLSSGAGFVDWKGLLRDLAQELHLDVDRETDLVSLAQFHVNAQGGNRHRLHVAIIDALTATNPPTENHRRLARLPIATWWTTNFDKLVETALREAGKVVDVKWDIAQLATTRPRRDAIVYKMHGDTDRPDEAVLTRDDYERYDQTRGAFTSALAGDLVSKTFLFLGFSFSDPNLAHVLSRVRLTFKNNQRRHFALFKRRAQFIGESDDEFLYARSRQLHIVEDLKRYNVQVAFVDEYSEIDNIIAELHRRYRRRTVFVSASASRFDPWGEAQVQRFMRLLGAEIVKGDGRLTTGLGFGVGDSLFAGAVERVLRKGGTHIEDAITARPFPQSAESDKERAAIWEKFRLDLISSAGIAVFLFGNKDDGGTSKLADGMRREFQLAREQGLVVLPIGATGSTAKVLADEVLATPLAELPGVDGVARAVLEELAAPTTDLESIVEPIARLITHVRTTF